MLLNLFSFAAQKQQSEESVTIPLPSPLLDQPSDDDGVIFSESAPNIDTQQSTQVGQFRVLTTRFPTDQNVETLKNIRGVQFVTASKIISDWNKSNTVVVGSGGTPEGRTGKMLYAMMAPGTEIMQVDELLTRDSLQDIHMEMHHEDSQRRSELFHTLKFGLLKNAKKPYTICSPLWKLLIELGGGYCKILNSERELNPFRKKATCVDALVIPNDTREMDWRDILPGFVKCPVLTETQMADWISDMRFPEGDAPLLGDASAILNKIDMNRTGTDHDTQVEQDECVVTLIEESKDLHGIFETETEEKQISAMDELSDLSSLSIDPLVESRDIWKLRLAAASRTHRNVVKLEAAVWESNEDYEEVMTSVEKELKSPEKRMMLKEFEESLDDRSDLVRKLRTPDLRFKPRTFCSPKLEKKEEDSSSGSETKRVIRSAVKRHRASNDSTSKVSSPEPPQKKQRVNRRLLYYSDQDEKSIDD
mmetsp:Transcript_308/g.1089  ORF Transcript_308/g.1089 Transcript_308/m.1089 type:complete len:477 (+) Transcript_308:2342-3772(+)